MIGEARSQGVRLQPASAELGIGTNTYRRWVRDDQVRRPQAMRPVSSHILSPEERQQVLAKRDVIYTDAKRQQPGLWSYATRNWTPRRTVWLNLDWEDLLVQRD